MLQQASLESMAVQKIFSYSDEKYFSQIAASAAKVPFYIA